MNRPEPTVRVGRVADRPADRVALATASSAQEAGRAVIQARIGTQQRQGRVAHAQAEAEGSRRRDYRRRAAARRTRVR